MNSDFQDIGGSSDVPEWLKRNLAMGLSGENELIWEEEDESAPAAFMESCDTAADVAFTLAQLRITRVRTRVELSDLPLPEYLGALAKRAGAIDLGCVFGAFAVQSPESLTTRNAGAFGRLVRAMGMDLGEALYRLKFTIAAGSGVCLPAVRVAMLAGGAQADQDLDDEGPAGITFETVWGNFVQTAEPKVVTFYHFLESEIRLAYNDNV